MTDTLETVAPPVELLTDEEIYLACILQDPSGLEQAEFLWHDTTSRDGCYRAFPYQWSWWRSRADRDIDQCARSTGKSERLMARVLAFADIHPGQEMVLLAPEKKHVRTIAERFEARIQATRFYRECLKGGRNGITHDPIKINWSNGARLIGVLPGRSGTGAKGCMAAGVLVLTRRGLIPIEQVAVGDQVWSHELRWSPVLHVESFEDECYEVRGQGSWPVVVSQGHRIYGRRNLATPKQKRRLDTLHWESVDDMALEDNPAFHWASTGTFAREDVPAPEFGKGMRVVDWRRDEFWWIVGRWLADGNLSSGLLPSGKRGSWRLHITTKVTRRSEITDRLDALSWHWRAAPKSGTKGETIEFCSKAIALWMLEHFGQYSGGKGLPVWMLGANRAWREALLNGYMTGDGSRQENRSERAASGSASRRLSLGLGLLGQSLGRCAGYGHVVVADYVTEIAGVKLKKRPQDSWRLRLTDAGHGKGLFDGPMVTYKIRSVRPAGRHTVYNVISEDHSYLADGIFHHNTHPIWLSCDEAQDLSELTWNELPEVIRWEVPGAKWMCHGVSKGVRDKFYHYTQSGSGFAVHRYMAIDKPTYNKAEREQKIKEYGGNPDSPDFRRNFYGVHGNTQNRIFNLNRLMSCRDDIETSEYNTAEYYYREIRVEEVLERAREQDGRIEHATAAQAVAIAEMVTPPPIHTSRHEVFWMGMDVGLVEDPSEILVFAEYHPDAKELRRDRANAIAVPDDGVSRLKLLTRVKAVHIPEPLQDELVMHLIDHYRPRAFSMDATGNGLPLFQRLQKRAGTSRLLTLDYVDDTKMPVVDQDKQAKAKQALTVIKGYNFSGKVVVEFDEQKVDDLPPGSPIQDIVDKAGIKRYVKDAATDELRQLVETSRLALPFDDEVTNDLNAQTWSYSQDPVDAYGRRRMRFSAGSYHILDAARMAVIGRALDPIERFVNEPPKKHGPVRDHFG